MQCACADLREFVTILKGGLAAAGFLAQGSDKADFVLVGKLTLDDANRQNNWYWMRGTVEVSLVEKESGRVRGSRTWPIKASARDVKTVRSQVLIEAEKLLKQDVLSGIIDVASGEATMPRALTPVRQVLLVSVWRQSRCDQFVTITLA